MKCLNPSWNNEASTKGSNGCSVVTCSSNFGKISSDEDGLSEDGLPFATSNMEVEQTMVHPLTMKVIQEEQDGARRIEEQNRMLANEKLCLVLDLDDTLLSSVLDSTQTLEQKRILRKKEKKDRKKPQRHLFRRLRIGRWVKLRQGIWNFLEKASKLYQLHICTLGHIAYAKQMANILDPTGALFQGRVLSKYQSAKVPNCKDFDGVLGTERTALIVDDRADVWPDHERSLIHVDGFMHFRSCSDKSIHQGRIKKQLASVLTVLERIHQKFFSSSSLHEADVRDILAAEQRKVLAGCHILFSGIFQFHPLWRTASKFGALCTNQMNSQVTHVVPHSSHAAEEVKWGLSTGKFVVDSSWIQASAFSYQRANESDFTLEQQSLPLPVDEDVIKPMKMATDQSGSQTGSECRTSPSCSEARGSLESTIN